MAGARAPGRPRTASGTPAQRRIRWQHAYRLIPSRFPTISPWERIADAADYELLAGIEGLTNPRLREELGALSLIPKQRRVSGPGTTPIMAAFTHLNPEGSRFSDGSFGVFYASRELDTAIRETVYHRERFLQRTAEPAGAVQMRCYHTHFDVKLHDLRGGFRAQHDPDDYTASQQLALRLRAAGSDGLVYDSVRRKDGQCAALFWPDCVAPCTQAGHYAYHWDGTRIAQVVELKAVPL
ncbi:MAG: RES family NAD+ phosphorylase [Steroidobacteraceae bacterium]